MISTTKKEKNNRSTDHPGGLHVIMSYVIIEEAHQVGV